MLIRLEQYYPRGDIVSFNAIVNDSEDYLLGFAKPGKIALSKDLIGPYNLASKLGIAHVSIADNKKLKAEMLFHEAWASVHGEQLSLTDTDVLKHKEIYNGKHGCLSISNIGVSIQPQYNRSFQGISKGGKNLTFITQINFISILNNFTRFYYIFYVG